MQELTYRHPALQEHHSRLFLAVITLLRACFLSFLVVVFDRAVDFGTAVPLLAGGVVAGTLLGTILAFSTLRVAGAAALSLLCYLGLHAALAFLAILPIAREGWFFALVSLREHLWLIGVFLMVAAVSTWLFWRIRHFLTVELVGFFAVGIHLLSGHRNYHFESPRIVNTLAWELGISQLWSFIIVGAGISALLIFYGFVTSLPIRARPYFEYTGFKPNYGRIRWIAASIFIGVLVAMLYLLCGQIFQYYHQEVLTRTANGVGEESEEGLSPLDFHSALGSTNQPAALVRLEGDYNENPFSPMLYLRESALSEFNGREIVLASTQFDQDVAGTTPSQPFIGIENPRLAPRTPVNQSIFLLTDHKLSFALDYPLSITPVKNPNPQRFRAAFRTYSMAPAFPIATLRGMPVGDPSWPDETWKHYLELHGDPRYAELAEKIVGQASHAATARLSPTYFTESSDLDEVVADLARSFSLAFIQETLVPTDIAPSVDPAFAITDYLSKVAIYTLTPNHEVGPDEDPVAPFLFGDKRGYCVHFAHATVFMLRALGIPSRIGTGYLTDLKQSRDGHILLRMSDRHAWAEVFIRDRGWVPFDTQPENVESHADTQVDMKMLEELMDLLGPTEDILPPEASAEEPSTEFSRDDLLPDRKTLLYPLLGLLAFALFIKVYLRYAWLLPATPATKLRRSYRAVASSLYDLGHSRWYGETREEFRRRICEKLGAPTLSLTGPLNVSNYSADNHSLDIGSIGDLRRQDMMAVKRLPLWRRMAGMLSPASLFAHIARVRW